MKENLKLVRIASGPIVAILTALIAGIAYQVDWFLIGAMILLTWYVVGLIITLVRAIDGKLVPNLLTNSEGGEYLALIIYSRIFTILGAGLYLFSVWQSASWATIAGIVLLGLGLFWESSRLDLVQCAKLKRDGIALNHHLSGTL